MATNPNAAIYLSRFKAPNGRILAESQERLFRVSISGFDLPEKALIDLYVPDQESLSLLAHALQKVTTVLAVIPQEQQKGEQAND